MLDVTGADGIMIGRAAQGPAPGCSAKSSTPEDRRTLPPAEVTEIHAILIAHLKTFTISTARKPVSRSPASTSPGIPKGLVGSAAFRKGNERPAQHRSKMQAVNEFFLPRRRSIE